MTDHLADLAKVLAEPGQPERFYQAIDAVCSQLVGHKLFTLLYRDGDEVARVYSNRPSEYPVSGRKRMGPTPWGDLVLKNLQPFLGRDKAAIRWAFFDHQLIESMGLGSAINIPAIYNGEVVGTMNLLDAEHHYEDKHLPPLLRLGHLLIPAFLEARRAAQ